MHPPPSSCDSAFLDSSWWPLPLRFISGKTEVPEGDDRTVRLVWIHQAGGCPSLVQDACLGCRVWVFMERAQLCVAVDEPAPLRIQRVGTSDGHSTASS